MRFGHSLHFLATVTLAGVSTASSVASAADPHENSAANNRTVSAELFAELEELARLVDIAYCVATTSPGILPPFECLSRCNDFENFELVTTFNTGPFLADSCGYIALAHPPANRPRVIVAFRGTYSLANTIADLSSIPQDYIPYPEDGDGDDSGDGGAPGPRCQDCTVHAGFLASWRQARDTVLPALTATLASHPTYDLELVGHSLGGAVAALAALELVGRGWDPLVTTFGEPLIGNDGLARYIDKVFGLDQDEGADGALWDAEVERRADKWRFRRVTHIGDPVPLLPLPEWGYAPHAGELYITKPDPLFSSRNPFLRTEVPQPLDEPGSESVRVCVGSVDNSCIAGDDSSLVSEGESPPPDGVQELLQEVKQQPLDHSWGAEAESLPLPFWNPLFAHRDYFWRLGVCLPTVIRSG